MCIYVCINGVYLDREKETPDTVRKLIETIKERYKLKDSKIHECYERLNEVSEKKI